MLYLIIRLIDEIEAPQKKPYDVNYKVRNVQEIIDMQRKEVQNIQTLLEVPVSVHDALLHYDTDFKASTAAILLRHYAWNSEKLQEQFWNDPAAALEAAGLSPPSSPSTSTASLPSPSIPSSSRRSTRNLGRGLFSPAKRTRSLAPSGPFECPVCCMDYDTSAIEQETFALGCGHRFCKICWKDYLTSKITTEGESAKVQCMESGCGRIVRGEVVEEMLPESVRKRYVKFLADLCEADL